MLSLFFYIYIFYRYSEIDSGAFWEVYTARLSFIWVVKERGGGGGGGGGINWFL